MEWITTYLLPCLWAMLACIGFGIGFNIHGLGILICGFGGALGWLVFLIARPLFGSDIAAAFVAAMIIAGYSETMARIRRCPSTGYLQVALLPLVPGAGVYYAMQHCVAGDTDRFLFTLLHTLGMAAALSVGAMLTTSVLRAILPRIHSGGR